MVHCSSVSFIVPLFNNLAETKAMLESLRATVPENLNFEIVLIDDFSSDGTREWMATLDDPSVKTLLNSTNLGFARSNNAAVRVASGEILALVNNDLVFAPGWLEPMLVALETPALNAGLVGNVQFRVSDNSLDHAGVRVTPLGKIEHIHALPDKSLEYAKVFAVTGACILIRRADFKDLDGFDEEYVNGGEDIDLCLRIRQRGKHVYVATKSTIHHHVSLSRNRQSSQNERNSRRIYKKWRREIKNELTDQWVLLLKDQATNRYGDYFDGEVSPALLDTPYAVARVIAESAMQQEEGFWARKLDGAALAVKPPLRCSTRGFIFSEADGGYCLDETAEFSVSGVDSLRDFFVCGRKLSAVDAPAIVISISVNEIQLKRFVLSADPNVNVGIVKPLVLPGIVNIFKISAQFNSGKDVERKGGAGKLILVTHLIVDDQIIEVF